MPLPERIQTEYLGPLIAKRRSPRIRAQYQAIGGGSPIKSWTEKQARMMEEQLDKLSPESAPHKGYIAFRYASPLTEEALLQMKADGVKRAVAFTQYPQWSCTTTGSSLNEIWRQLEKTNLTKEFSWSIIDRWASHPRFIELVTKKVQEGLSQFPSEGDKKDAIILFSAHSLPHKVINRGDAYPQEIGATVQRVMESLNFSNKFMLCYQSQVGPVAWLGPQTVEMVSKLGQQGKKNVLVVPIAFTSDHIETLYELDIEVKEQAHKNGVSNYFRSPSLNDDPLMGTLMAELVAEHLKGDKVCSTQYPLRCGGCVNPQCRNIVNPNGPYAQPPLHK